MDVSGLQPMKICGFAASDRAITGAAEYIIARR